MTYRAYDSKDNHIATGFSFKVDDGILRLYANYDKQINGQPDSVFAPGHWACLIFEEEN